MPYNPLAVEAKFGKHQQIALGRLQCVVVTHMLPYTTNKVFGVITAILENIYTQFAKI